MIFERIKLRSYALVGEPRSYHCSRLIRKLDEVIKDLPYAYIRGVVEQIAEDKGWCNECEMMAFVIDEIAPGLNFRSGIKDIFRQGWATEDNRAIFKFGHTNPNTH